MTLEENLAALEARLPELRDRRNAGPLQNDIYEAVDDCCHLGRRAIENDTRVNYPARAQSENAHLRTLREFWVARDQQELELYQRMLDAAHEMIQQIAEVPLAINGHLGVLKTIRKHFGWLLEQFGFTIADEQPTGVCLASGRVSLELAWATQSSLSFALTRDKANHFWLEDLLFLHGDSRYRTVPISLDLKTEKDIESWFSFVSEVLRKYGQDLLTDQAEAWSRLAEAQSKRDAEYVAMMNAKYGQHSAARPCNTPTAIAPRHAARRRA
jgi:hypothetical protein